MSNKIFLGIHVFYNGKIYGVYGIDRLITTTSPYYRILDVYGLDASDPDLFIGYAYAKRYNDNKTIHVDRDLPAIIEYIVTPSESSKHPNIGEFVKQMFTLFNPYELYPDKLVTPDMKDVLSWMVSDRSENYIKRYLLPTERQALAEILQSPYDIYDWVMDGSLITHDFKIVLKNKDEFASRSWASDVLFTKEHVDGKILIKWERR